LDIHAFLKHLLRHLRGPVVLLWDRGTIHRRKEVKQYILKHSRLQAEYFPAYAPEVNPSEYVWNQADHVLANSAPEDLAELKGFLRNSTRRIRKSQKLLWSCIYASDLPWAR
jgi:putative transposase